MCGLFGYVGPGPRAALLSAVAREASRRGPHSYGWVASYGDRIDTVRENGMLTDAAVARLLAEPVQGVIGVCRLATFGDWRVPANNQPIQAGPLWIVHNGNFYNSPGLQREYGITPSSESDTEMLGLLIGKLRGTLQARVRAALALARPLTRQAVLVMEPPYILAESQGHPLYAFHDDSGVYFCSRPITGYTGISFADTAGLLRIGGKG